ncbi:hydroxysteroid dehydrogenase-like protein 2 isoform X2 [Stegostoma tigrinum]|uniref:hydroxysteroid dehydrogenase-like protein 2 isoform X2 n=1 Tax=Stegostoma tigrinum TaxID=3053191 RepID=UPI00202B6E89|nr:hydroxysteroid dehydrogenase-like protein 2 isoform X2 [Stegostoma tigrinum]
MLQNTGKLAGRTLFITGASRGIGKAIALKAAKDGANVVIAAKTAQAHPKLPGTIYTAAEEIEAAGGNALPCVVDVRNEEQISEAVENAVKTFGGIDILINNASAINLTGTLETPMKKVDLMMSINSRGTYLTSKLCIPYLKKSQNGHILNLSPPLNMNPVWFKNHCAYTMAKYGMSMCVLGMAEEFKGEIAVNALWPKTAIHTAAMDMLGGSGVSSQCRKPEIMADAAYAIFLKPKTFTGNFVIDEELLKEEGIRDFDIYAVDPGHPLLPDFFLDEEPEALAKKMQDHGEHPGTWYIDLKNGSGSIGHGSFPGKADVLMSMSSEDFVKMFAGKMKPTMAFMSGKLKVKGDMSLAIKLESLMTHLKAKL